MPAPPRAGAVGPAGGARVAPSLLLSLLLGASAPLWLRAEKLGESGEGVRHARLPPPFPATGGVGVRPTLGGGIPAALALLLCGSVA